MPDATQEALKRVAEAEVRIRSLADNVYKDEGYESPTEETKRRVDREFMITTTTVSGVTSPVQSTPCESVDGTDGVGALVKRVQVLEEELRAQKQANEAFQTKVMKELEDRRHMQYDSPFRRSPSDHNEKSTNELRLESLFQIPSALSIASTSARSPMVDQDKLRVITFVHMAFDDDNNGLIGYKDASLMQEKTEGTQLTKEEWTEMCSYIGADPDRGLDVSDFCKMYTDSRLDTDLTRDCKVARTLVEDLEGTLPMESIWVGNQC